MATDKKERKLIILQSLAGMLEERDSVKITTAELAKRSEISEAAIYKHFPSKRKIFEELVIFFEFRKEFKFIIKDTLIISLLNSN